MDLYVNDGKKEGSNEILNNPGMPTAGAPAQSGMSYPGSRTPTVAHGGVVPLGGPGARSAARNGVEPYLHSSTHPVATWNVAARPGALAEPHLGFSTHHPAATWNVASHHGALVEPYLRSSMHPAATWSGAAYTDWLAAHLSSSSGGPPHHQAVHDGAPYPDADGLIMAQLRSGGAPRTPWNWNAVACPGVSPAAWNDGAYPAVAVTPDTNAAEAGLGSQRPRPTATAAAATATEQSGGGGCYYHHHHSGDMAAPFTAQVVVDVPEDSDSLVKDSAIAQQDEAEDEVAGAVAEPVRGGGGLVGVAGQLGAAAMTLAVAGLTAGGDVNPSTAVPLFLMLIAGVTLVTVRVVRG